MLPLYTAYGSTRGHVTRGVIQHYRDMASGGAAMVVTENVVVNSRQSHFGFLLRGDDDSFLPGLAHLAGAIKEEGAVACCQINHAGRFAQVARPVSASRVPAFDGPAPHALSREEIQSVIGDYAAAAKRVKAAGFDMVELHGATGYLPVQFLSPRTNRRDDQYGGDLENRMRFFLELVEEVRGAVGADFPVGCRFLADEWLPDGFGLSEARVLARRLEEKGVAYLSVTAGTYESMFKKEKLELSWQEGYMAHLAEEIKKEVSLPVIASGRIATPQLAEEILAGGRAHLVGLGRVLLVDHLWPRKARQGGEITRCRPQCDVCLQLAMRQKPVICAGWDGKRKVKFKDMSREMETTLDTLKSYVNLVKVKAARQILKFEGAVGEGVKGMAGPEDFDINGLIKKIAGGRGREDVAVRIMLPPGPILVRGDESKCQNKLLDMINQSYSIIPPGGVLEIKARLEECREGQENGNIHEKGVEVVIELGAGLYQRAGR
jgi:2,4-dienoyl-CoA reductase-like NADH-dependent reductase (Old Yellow Enzyme family)